MQQIDFCNMPTLVLIVICGLGPQLLMPLSSMLHTRAILLGACRAYLGRAQRDDACT